MGRNITSALNDVSDNFDMFKRVVTSNELFLFPKQNRSVKRRIFAIIEEIKTASLEDFNAIPINAYQKCFEDWKKH